MERKMTNSSMMTREILDRYFLYNEIYSDLVFLSIIIPAYNEEARLPATLRRLEQIDSPHSIEIIVVCDGCTDNTSEIAHQWTERLPLKVIAYPENKGKGYAVQRGVLSASGQIIAFMDADGSTPPAELLRLASPIVSGNADIVVGSRRVEGAIVKRQPLGRHLLGKLFSVITRSVLSLPYRDTQCGFKLFRRRCGVELFTELCCKGFEFDLEILYRAHKKKIAIMEVGVPWEDRAGSKVAPIRDGLKMINAMLRIRWFCMSSLSGRRLVTTSLTGDK